MKTRWLRHQQVHQQEQWDDISGKTLRHSGSSNQPWSRDLSLDQGWWERLLPDRVFILDRLIDFSDGLILFIWQKVVGSCNIYLLTGEVHASVCSSPVICPKSNQSVLIPLHWNPSLGWKPPVFIKKNKRTFQVWYQFVDCSDCTRSAAGEQMINKHGGLIRTSSLHSMLPHRIKRFLKTEAQTEVSLQPVCG